MKEENDRFIRVYQQGTLSVTEIWIDAQTGVNYLFHTMGSCGGLTPLLDEYGRPVISDPDEY